MNRTLALTLVIALFVGLEICILMFGWGLTPGNWWWVIGGGIVAHLFLKVIGDKV